MPNFIDLTGKRYGRLTVLEKDTSIKKGQKIRWICQCDCGTIKSVQGANLRSNLTKSCGCLHKDKISLDLVGQKFGRLTVIEKTNERTQDRGIIWKCQCECGQISFVSTNNLKQDITKSCGCLKQSHGELMVEQYLIEKNIQYKKEYCFSDLLSKKGGHLRFDFAIFNNNELIYLIEFDGSTHNLEHLNGWLTKEKVLLQQENDEIKNTYCQHNNLNLIRINSLKDIKPILDKIFN